MLYLGLIDIPPVLALAGVVAFQVFEVLILFPDLILFAIAPAPLIAILVNGLFGTEALLQPKISAPLLIAPQLPPVVLVVLFVVLIGFERFVELFLFGLFQNIGLLFDCEL